MGNNDYDHTELKSEHNKIPIFLLLVYAVLIIWAVYYALTIKGPSYADYDYRPVTAGKANGGDLYQAQCAGCHGGKVEQLAVKAGSREAFAAFMSDPGAKVGAMAGLKLSQEQVEQLQEFIFQ
jgi:mono/diheme cytochrome c family protein